MGTFSCNGYLGHPFVKEASQAFTARLFFVVSRSSAIEMAGEWYSWPGFVPDFVFLRKCG